MARLRSRSGFSLIELIVVLGLLLLLAAFLVPFLFRARGNVARSQSMNNLRQIGLALHNHSDAYKRMPPTAGKGPDGRVGSAHYHLLPFIEQAPLYNLGTVWQADTVGVAIPVYIDPRDTTAAGNKWQDWLATTSYAANWLALKNGEANLGNGFPDGTSNTILFAQRYQICNDTPCAWAFDRLYYWAPMTGYYTVANFQSAPKGAECDPARAQAFDANGILVCMGDVVVRNIANSVSPQTWHLALTPDDGQPLPGDFQD